MATSGVMRVDNYQVDLRRFSNVVTKGITLRAPVGDTTSQVTTVILAFRDDWASMQNRFTSDPTQFYAFLPREDFYDYYAALQGDAPWSFFWRSDAEPAPEGNVSQFILFTGEEPPGEGPRDETP